MREKEESLYQYVLEKIEFNNRNFNFETYEHREKYLKVKSFLEAIVYNVGCTDYLFILLVTKLEERFGKSITDYLWEILDNYCNFPDLFSIDVAFAAYYNLALHYYRCFDTKSLKNLISQNVYFNLFYQEYPLIYEAISRYCIINNMYDRQMLLAECTLKKIAVFAKKDVKERTCINGYIQTGTNIAPMVSYVSSICSIFEHCYVRGKINDNTPCKHNLNIEVFDVSSELIIELINREEKVEYNVNIVEQFQIDLAMEYINNAIEYNPSYPKYYFLKAQLLFYSCLYRNENFDMLIRDEVIKLIDEAINKENIKASDYNKRCSKYFIFKERIKDFTKESFNKMASSKNAQYENQKDEILQMTECPVPQKRPKVFIKNNDSYAFISYSTRDFKPVYCDIIEMQRMGIQYWYDEGTTPGISWDVVVEPKIAQASCIICYISSNFLTSPAILKELKYIEKYNKPIICIDLTGKKQIAQIIIDTIKNGNEVDTKRLNSDVLNIATRLFNDDTDVIVRDNDPLVMDHMLRIEKVIMEKYNAIIRNTFIEQGIWINNKVFEINNKQISKPQEDYVCCDLDNKIFIVADGISRKSLEYATFEGSIAYDITKLFCEKMHEELIKVLNDCLSLSMLKEGMKDAFLIVNEKVNEYLKINSERYLHNEIPGCVAVVAVIYNQVLCYAGIGDCVGLINRNNNQIIFSDKQTTYVFDKLHLENERDYLMKYYVNNIDNINGYGVVNGDKNAINYFKISHIDLEYNDVVYLMSDGISDYVCYTNANKTNTLSIEDIYIESKKMDDKIKKPYYDDKAIIRIRLGD